MNADSRLCFLVCLICLPILSIQAACRHCPEEESKFTFGVFVDAQSYKYIEPSVMDIGGMMSGLGLNASYSNHEVIQFLTAEYMQGALTYNGETCNIITGSCTPLTANSKDWYTFAEYYVKPIVGEDTDFVSTLDFGLGYRFLHNRINSALGYTRKQSYIYLLAGASIEYKLSKLFKLYGSAHYRYLIRGFNTSYMQELGYDNNLNFMQKDGHGAKAIVGIKLDLERYNLNNYIFIAAYFDWWSLEGSDIQMLYNQGANIANFQEPKNNTQAFGVMIGTGF